LGEEVVLPWALAGLPVPEIVTSGGDALIPAAHELSRELTEQVWGTGFEEAAAAASELMSVLRGVDPSAAVPVLRALKAPDRSKAAHLLGILDRLSAELVEKGAVADEGEAWRLDLDGVGKTLEHGSRAVQPRFGIGRWEPFVAAVVLSTSPPSRGVAASPGIGAGLSRDAASLLGVKVSPRRAVIAAGQPLPGLASLLWDAAAIVTSTGGPAAHLFEAARSLRVPAVTGVDLGRVGDEIIAVDGNSGVVATLPRYEEA
jgi:hypothetical protein